MKKTTIILSALFIMLNITVYAQTGGVVIANGTATADGSAMLDVQSDTKGMLVPRMTTVQRTAISSPATGLLVFDNTTGSFWFYNGSTWKDLSGVPNKIADTDNDTKVQVEKNADEDIIRFELAGTEHWRMTGKRLENIYNGYSVFIGEDAGKSDEGDDNQNVFVGYHAAQANISGQNNVAIGYNAMHGNVTGHLNTCIGKDADVHGTNSVNATAIGYAATANANNVVRLGSASVAVIGGYANWSNVSDGRFKTNLKENVAGLDFIMKLRPLTYHLDMDAIASFNKTPDNSRLAESEQLKAAEVQIGFIAQEVEEAATELGFDFHGVDKPQNKNSHYGLRYAEFVVPLVKAVQEQQALISQQQDLLSKYESTFEEMNNRMEMLEAKVSDQHSEKYVVVK